MCDAGTSPALLLLARHVAEHALVRPFYMMKNTDPQLQHDEEPIGIVISRGPRDAQLPRFSAYVWAPAPTEPVVARAAQAA